MKKNILIVTGATAAGLMLLSATPASAFGSRFNADDHTEQGFREDKPGLNLSIRVENRLGLRLSDEEREQIRSGRKEKREEHRAEMLDFVGLDEAQIRERISAGESMGDILKDQDKTVEEIGDFFGDRVVERIATLTEEGRIDDNQAVTFLERAIEKVNDLIDRWFGND